MTVYTPRGTIEIEDSPISDERIARARAKAFKNASYLGPWCSRCGKKGNDCKNEKTCRARALKNATKGLDVKAMHGITLPRPPREWYESKGRRVSSGYGSHTQHDPIGDATQYAYEIAMGKWKP